METDTIAGTYEAMARVTQETPEEMERWVRAVAKKKRRAYTDILMECAASVYHGGVTVEAWHDNAMGAPS